MEILPAKKEYVVLDATLMSSMMGCARYYDIRFNHRMISVGGKSNSLETGALMHKVLEVYYKHRVNGFNRKTAADQAMIAGQMYIDGCPHCANVVDMPEDGQLQCKHEPGEYPGVFNTPEQNERGENGGTKTGWRYVLQTAEQYFEHYKDDSFVPIAVEEVRREILYEDDEIRVGWKAKFDLIVDTNQIGIISMDHKTMKQNRTGKSKLSNQFIGHCHLLKSRNVLVNKIGFQTSMKNIGDRLSREMISYSADHLEEWRSEILPYYAYKYLQYIDTGYWPPNYTHCDNIYGACAYKGVCESDRSMREQILRAEYIKAPVWDVQNKDEA